MRLMRGIFLLFSLLVLPRTWKANNIEDITCIALLAMNLTCEEEINCDKTIRFHLLSLWEGRGGGGENKIVRYTFDFYRIWWTKIFKFSNLWRKLSVPLEKEVFGKKISPLQGICNLHPSRETFILDSEFKVIWIVRFEQFLESM